MKRSKKLSNRHLEGTESITKQFLSPTLRGQRNIGIKPTVAVGGVHLAWYRGEHAGKAWCIKQILKRFPDAAAYLMEITGMNEDGEI